MELVHKYPKLLLLCASMVAAYLLYALGGLHWLDTANTTTEYVACFIGGILFTFGFTTPFGIGVFLEIGHSVNPVLGALIGGAGALLADMVIFQVMRFEFFHDEIHRLRTTKIAQWFHRIIHHESFPEKLRKYLLWSFAGIVIASPVPDEFGVALVSSLTDINQRTFALLSFSMNMLGILLLIGASALLVG